MFSYRLYGLHLSSMLRFPELTPGGEEKTDVVFRFGKVEPFHPDAEGMERLIQGEPDNVYMDLAGAARFLVRNGREVTVQPFDDVEESVLRIFLLGMVMGVVLHQRGYATFHAGAVGVAGGAVAFMGGQGSGKSTTAAAFQARGHTLLTDDILALTERNGVTMALPGFPRLKLMPDAARFLGESPSVDPRVHPSLRKHSFIAKERFAAEPLPLKRVYLLEKADRAAVVPLDRREALKGLLPNWYAGQFGVPMIRLLGSASHLSQCASLSRKVPVRLLKREASFDKITDMIRAVEEDLADDSSEKNNLG